MKKILTHFSMGAKRAGIIGQLTVLLINSKIKRLILEFIYDVTAEFFCFSNMSFGFPVLYIILCVNWISLGSFWASRPFIKMNCVF